MSYHLKDNISRIRKRNRLIKKANWNSACSCRLPKFSTLIKGTSCGRIQLHISIFSHWDCFPSRVVMLHPSRAPHLDRILEDGIHKVLHLGNRSQTSLQYNLCTQMRRTAVTAVTLSLSKDRNSRTVI